MVGFSDLSDTDESAIDEIISQAQDACVLEQLSAINGASFTDSVLPTHLESRFRKLKTFPASNTHSNFSPSKQNPRHNTCSAPPSISSPSLSDSFDSSPLKEISHRKKGLQAKSEHASVSPGSEESSLFSPFKPNPDEEKRLKQKPKSASLSSPLTASNSFVGSPSPPRKAGCFWCSPKKESSKKKSKENLGVIGWDKSDELLSDLGSFSSKQQQKMLKMAIKEEEKISREAEKIVKWAKQASSRMNFSDIDDD